MTKDKNRTQLDLWDLRKSTSPSSPKPPKGQRLQDNKQTSSPSKKGAGDPDIFTVKQIVRRASSLLESHFRQIWVEGEVSNCKKSPSGHLYFTIKDDSAQLSVVMFRSSLRKVPSIPETGQKVRCRGRLSIYPASGRFQLYAEWVEKAGLGELLAAMERLKKKLAQEGLFDPARKRLLPSYPRIVGVVTSPVGAAIRDIHQVLWRRWPVKLLLSPAPVQGADAPRKLVAALKKLERFPHIDVIIFGRGGGSTEDLASFSDEQVVRAVASCRHPIISAVGHEVDVSLCDLAADKRAPTPSAAAELAVPRQDKLTEELKNFRSLFIDRMTSTIEREKLRISHTIHRLEDPRRALAERRQDVDRLSRRLVNATTASLMNRRRRQRQTTENLRKNHPARRLKDQKQLLSVLRQRSIQETQHLIKAHKQRLQQQKFLLRRLGGSFLTHRQRQLAQAQGRLKGLNPLSVLERGYSLVTDPNGAVVRRSEETQTGQQVNVRLHKGSLSCTVDKIDSSNTLSPHKTSTKT